MNEYDKGWNDAIVKASKVLSKDYRGSLAKSFGYTPKWHHVLQSVSAQLVEKLLKKG